jgi:NhaA family Na+:H+ antiporter
MAPLLSRVQDFLRLESAAGLLLAAAAAVALLASNTPLHPFYDAALSMPVSVQVGDFEIAKPLLLWINDGLMAVFFFLVGLEIKREILQGELSALDKALLPAIAAIGGVAAPALIYLIVNLGDPAGLAGWAIPSATDIAFALGILALFGSRVPTPLKVFLLAIAIIDDLGAIVIIAMFYTADLSLVMLGLAAAGVIGLFALNRSGVKAITPYALIGVFIWTCVLKSGVHATLAGVITALMIPIRGRSEDDPSPLHRLELGLHPWVAYLVLPAFAFANAGISFAGLRLSDLVAPVPLGVALGLFVGKQIGVFGATMLAVGLRLARLPDGVDWRQVYAVSCLAGIGFTMSLFIGTLAFDGAQAQNAVRLGVMAGSLASAALGAAVLHAALPARSAAPAAGAGHQ